MLNLVESPSFKKMMNSLNPRFVLPSESYYRQTLMPHVYDVVRAQVIRLMRKDVKFCSITTDMWSSPNVDSYMSVTVHYISPTWDRKIVTLDCLPFPEKHTAENIAKIMQRTLDDFSLSDKLHLIVRDNASNVVKSMELGRFASSGCFLHGLNLVVSNNFDAQQTVIDLIVKVT